MGDNDNFIRTYILVSIIDTPLKMFSVYQFAGNTTTLAFIKKYL